MQNLATDEVEVDQSLPASIQLYYDLYLPPTDAPRPLLIAVHGYGAHKRYMMREARLVAPADFAIASIQAPHQHFRKVDDGYRVGFGWLTDHRPAESIELHHKFINDLTERLDADGTIDPSRIYLYGFSQACALNFRYAFTYPDRLRGVIGVCGGIPGDLETYDSYRQFMGRTLYLYGDDDEFYPLEKFEQFDAALRKRIPDYESIAYSAKHEITSEMRADIKRFLSSDVS